MNLLQAIVGIYIRKERPRAQREIAWFRQQPSLRAAVEKAALAVNSEKKRHKHQRRIKRASLEHARVVLCENLAAIEQVRDFDQLHALLDRILRPIPRIGELYIYDTSLRIGAKLNLLPTKVYLHAGTRVGVRALGLDASGPVLNTAVLPYEFRSLPPHEVEDILCIFKDRFRVRAIADDGR